MLLHQSISHFTISVKCSVPRSFKIGCMSSLKVVEIIFLEDLIIGILMFLFNDVPKLIFLFLRIGGFLKIGLLEEYNKM